MPLTELSELREAIRFALSNHAVALPIVVAGYGSVVFEFLRPGKAWPGSLGGALLVLGVWGLWNAPAAKRWPVVVVLAVVCAILALTAALAYVACRGWSSKVGE